jgi:hypothetical protein
MTMLQAILAFVTHPLFVSLWLATSGLLLITLLQIVLPKVAPETNATARGIRDGLITVAVSVMIVPVITNVWAERRDQQNENRRVRAAHLDRLRKTLQTDVGQAVAFSDSFRRSWGPYIGVR